MSCTCVHPGKWCRYCNKVREYSPPCPKTVPLPVQPELRRKQREAGIDPDSGERWDISKDK